MHLTNNTKPRVESQLYSIERFIQPSQKANIASAIKYRKFFFDDACRVLGVSRHSLKTDRTHLMARKRFAVIYVMRKKQNKSFHYIRNILALRTASATRRGCERAEYLLENDPAFANMIDALEMVA